MSIDKVNKVITVILDTNIIVSSLVFGGKPRNIYLLIIDGRINAFYSPFLLFETIEVLRYKFNFDDEKLEAIKRIVRAHFVKILPKLIPKLSEDLADNKIIAIAQEVKADYLITGDKKHLLPLKKIGKTKVVSAEEFLKQFNQL